LSRFLQKGKKRAKSKTSPSYPLWSILERAGFGSCNLESNIQEKDASTWVLALIIKPATLAFCKLKKKLR